MDSKDLMVGDWVAYKDDPPYIVRGTSICKVVTIDNGIDHRNVMDNAINPIPLTEDILVKNGWDFTKRKYGVHCKEDTNQDAELSKDDDGFYWSINTDEYVILRIDYVHQLQHLLRLCCIDKEIEL